MNNHNLHESVFQKKRNSKQTLSVSRPNIPMSTVKIVRGTGSQKDAPYFFDSNSNLYNRHFDAIDPKSLVSSNSNPISYDIGKNTHKFPGFPDPEHYQQFADYEKAVIQWKDQITHTFRGAHFPKPISHLYFRPFFLKSKNVNTFENQSKATNNFPLKNNKGNQPYSLTPKIHTKNHLINPNVLPKSQSTPNKIKNNHKQKDKKNKKPRSIIDNSVDFNGSQGNPRIKQNQKSHDNFKNSYYIDQKQSKNTWFNELIPEEPDEKDYDTFGEFEHAYQRWSSVVVGSIKTLPPHCKDFIKFYGLITKENKVRKEKKRKETINYTRSHYSKETKKNKNCNYNQNYYSSWVEKINYKTFQSKKMCKQMGMDYFLRKNLKITYEEWKRYEYMYYDEIILYGNNFFEKKKNIDRIILLTICENILKIRNIMDKIENNKSSKDIGIIRGTYPHLLFGKKKSILTPRSLSCLSIRRTDKKSIIKKYGKDCQNEIENRKVQFVVPIYQDDEPIEIKKLLSDQYYRKRRSINLKQINRYNDKDGLSSWYYPKKYTKSKKRKLRKYCNYILRSKKIKNNYERIFKIITSELALDLFTKFLHEKYDTYINSNFIIITQMMNVNIINQLIELFFNTNNELTQSKNFLCYEKTNNILINFKTDYR
ncbi:sca1 complex scaffold protein scaa [Anaeramoeba flamelloides]|uniref:Sca1 complex scaffold protein scaa n=1 Tax=Anaeramoeba flamelloides TaxID=1746091 RepID=A0ABQ8YSN4_9EUKA|nr:sca1 complex scaffold protein scaa [Anaeramoeba flamelloides]